MCSVNHLTEQSSRQAPERTVHELLQPLPAVSALPCLQNAPAAHRQINIALPHKIQIRIQVHRKSRWKCKIVMSASIGRGQKEQRGGGVTSATFICLYAWYTSMMCSSQRQKRGLTNNAMVNISFSGKFCSVVLLGESSGEIPIKSILIYGDTYFLSNYIAIKIRTIFEHWTEIFFSESNIILKSQ